MKDLLLVLVGAFVGFIMFTGIVVTVGSFSQ